MKAKATPSIQVIDRLSLLLEAIAGNDRPNTLKVLTAETALKHEQLHP